MKLVVISYPEWLNNEVELLTKLFGEGLLFFHLRKPNASETEVEQFICQISSDYRNRIIIHNHFNLAEKYDLGGIHFNAATKGDYNNFKTWKGIQTWACHSLDELKIVPMQVNYVFLSPIFPSISKPEYSTDWNFSTLKTVLDNHNGNQDVIALGGIKADRISDVAGIGFDGVAVLGSVWEPLVNRNDGDACIANFRLLRERCQ